MTEAVLEPVRATFRAVATTVVPETEALDPGGWSALEQVVERALSTRPERLRRQVALFLRVIDLLPMVTHRSRFTHLAAPARTAVLGRLERSPLLLVRRGFWGLRTLVMMGYYTQPEVIARLGYRAHPDGWSARRRSGEHAVPALPPITLDVPAVPDEALRHAGDTRAREVE